MTAARVVLMVLLAVTLDLATPVVPTAGGLQWDDDEEVVHLRRSRPLAHVVAEEPAAPLPRADAPARRAFTPPLVRAALVWRPLPRPSDPAARLDPSAPSEPH
jgi:hypothetical protein